MDKFFEFFNFSTAQLKILLGLAIAAIGVVYVVGTKTNDMSRDFKEVKENIKTMSSDIKDLKTDRKTDFNLIYNDMIDMNQRNNELWNKKFSILIKYGATNKELLLDLVSSEEERQKIIEENLKKERLNNINDTSNMKFGFRVIPTKNIRVKKVEK
jgi:signal transduction protein with GAF and PtsI domain